MSDMTFNIAWVQKNTESLDKVAAQLEVIDDRLGALDRKKADPKVSVDTTEANAKLDDLNKKISNLSVSKVGAGIFGGIAGAGAIVGASLLTIPAAITAIGIAAEKSNPQVVAAFGNMTQAAKQTAQAGFSPLVPALTQFAGEAQNALGSVKNQLAESAVAAAPLLSIVGTDFITATKQGIGASVPIIQSLRPVAQAAGDDIVKVEQGVMGFLGKLDAGPAAQGLSELGTDVEALLPPIGTLVNDIVPLGNDLLNLVGPALNDTAQDAHLLAVPLQAVGSAVGFMGPVIGAAVPPVLALAGGTKLLTGSWTDFGGAATKFKSVFQDANGEFDRGRSTLDSLAGVVGVNTKSARDAAVATATEAATRTAATAAIDKQAVAEAQEAVTADGSAKNKRALAMAQAEATASAEADAAAQRALAEAEGASMISLGPLGIALGVAGAALALFGLSEQKATPPTQDLTSEMVKLASAAPDAVQGIIAGNPALAELINKAGDAGVNVKGMIAAYRGGPETLQTFSTALAQQQKTFGDTVIGISQINGKQTQVQNLQRAQSVESIKELSDQVNSGKVAYDLLDPSVKKLVDQYNHQSDVQTQLATNISDLRTQQQAENQVLAQQGIVLPQVTQNWNALGVAIGQRSTDFDSATAGVKGMTDNLVAADSAFFGAQANFAQLDAAVTSADQALQQAGIGVVNAQHAVAQASQGVASARNGERQAILGVTNAQDQLTKADQAERTAQVGLTLARQQAAQTLKDLQRQVVDQADTEASAQLQLLDAQNAVKAAGLSGKTLGDLGGPTTANEANYRLLLSLQQAQHAVNDATAQGKLLADQNAAAQAAGVDGSAQVVAAQQQVTQSHQGAKQAAQALQQAQQGVAQASQAVANAQLGEQQASAAVKQASAAQHAASVALTVAKEADSRSTDLNSAAGVRNFQTIEQLFEANKKATNDIGLATQATEAQGQQMGITKGSVDDVITSLTKIPLTTPFAIVGTPSLNLTALIGQASAQGISPFSLGLPHGDVQLALDTLHGKASGGLIQGPGTGTSDSILAIGSGGPLRVSDGEYIVRASETAKNLGLLEAINSGSYPGFASGGQVDAKSLMAVNYRLAGWDGFLQGTSSILQAFGKKTPNLPTGSGSIDFGNIGIRASGASGTLGSVAVASGSAAQAQAYAQSIMGNYGWGPEQWIPWLKLGNEESGWNANAVNASSGAYGIGQALGHGHPYALGDYANQVVWMANYIKGRYGNPAAAWAFETSHTPNWYRGGGLVDALKAPKVRDNGGPIDPGWNAIYNGTGRPETSRSGTQEDALLAELRAIGQRLDKLGDIHVHQAPGTSASEVADMVMRRMRFLGRR